MKKAILLTAAAACFPLLLPGCTKRSDMVSQPDHQYVVHRAVSPITLDGSLDDPAWKNAERTPPFGFANGAPGKPKLRTEAMMLWDDTTLYIGFDVEDHDIWSGYTRDKDPIYEEEVVEFFANPKDDMREYYEFQVSPANVRFYAFFTSHRSDLREAMKWEAPWRSAVKINGNLNKRDGKDTGYTVEMAIPFSDFHVIGGKPPKPGDHWRADMFRFERPARSRLTEAHAWSPTPSWDFHSMQDWGWIIFSGK